MQKKILLLLLCCVSTGLLLWYGLCHEGCFRKEREAVQVTLTKTQDLLDELNRTTVEAKRTVKDIKLDYNEKTRHLPKVIKASHQLIVTLQYAIILLISLVSIHFVVRWLNT